MKLQAASVTVAAALMGAGLPANATAPAWDWAKRQQLATYSVVALGDSVPSGAACNCTPYPRQVAGRMAAAHGAAVQYTSKAGGFTSRHIELQLDEPATQELIRQSQVTIVEVSANDFDPGLAYEERCLGAAGIDGCYADQLSYTEPRLARIAAKIKALQGQGNHGQLIMLGYWNVFLDGAVGARQGAVYQQVSDALTRRVNSAVYQAAVLNGGVYVDAYRAFKGSGANDPTWLLAADGDHPNAAGHRRLADVVEAIVPGYYRTARRTVY